MLDIKKNPEQLILGLSIFLGLTLLGLILGKSAIEVKEFERTVWVKGLSEKEFPADLVLWPIEYSLAENDFTNLYSKIGSNNSIIKSFLLKNGINENEISVSPPQITDKFAQMYDSGVEVRFRYTAIQTITVYSKKVDVVRKLTTSIADLGKKGIVFNNNEYSVKPEYFFTKLNEIKPSMIEEATRKAREVAEKFANDSDSKLGKIKTADQGQFTISERDINNPQIKKVRVVSTIEYYLVD